MAVKASVTITISKYRDCDSIIRYYKLQASTAAVPAIPTTLNPSGWSTAEPTYTSGSTNSLYYTDCYIFSDGTFQYTDDGNGKAVKSSSYEAAKEAWNKAQAAQDIADETSNKLASKDIIVGTQSASTRFWTGISQLESLQDGDEILYWLPYADKAEAASNDKTVGVNMRVNSTTTKTAGTLISSFEGSSVSNVWLNLTLKDGTTKTGWIPCYYGGTTRLTTHYGAGNCIRLVYKVNANVAGVQYTGFFGDANYVDGNNTNLLRFQQNIKAALAITNGQLIAGTVSGYKPIAANLVFDLDKPILVAAANLAANATGNNNFTVRHDVNIRTTNGNSSWTATQYETLYLVGILNGNQFTVDSTTPFTTNIPTTDDGKYYISLGYMYSTYQMILYPEHPIYKYVNDQFKNIAQLAYETEIDLNAIQADYLKESTFTTYKREQTENDQGIKTRLERTEVTIYGDLDNPNDPDALVNKIQEVETNTNTALDRLDVAEDTLEGSGLNDYDQAIKISQRFLNVETDVDQIKNVFKVTGGNNLVQNSVGYFADASNKPTMWTITSGTIYTPFGYDADLIGATISRGRLFCAKGTITTVPSNITALLTNKIMSISFKYKNGANATSKIKVFNGSVTFFEKTFSSTINDWTEYTFNPDTDPALANNSFVCTTNSLQISIESSNTTNNNGFEISDLMLNYGNSKPWELSNNEVYGAMVKLSSLGIEVTATTANTKNFMTTDGILVYAYDPATDTIIGSEPITKITDNGTLTNQLESTGDIIERNLVHTMIKDSSNNNIYVEYIR